MLFCILNCKSLYGFKFVVVETISPERCNEVHEKVANRPVPGVHMVPLVFELIVDTLHNAGKLYAARKLIS